MKEENYEKEIDAWRKERTDGLRSPDGWLNLTGLYELKEGVNRFGSDSSNDLIFPGENTPGHIGTFILDRNSLSMDVEAAVEVNHQGNGVRSMKLKSDREGQPSALSLGSFRWSIIQRGSRFFVRLRDLNSPLLDEFHGVETFEADPRWCIEAVLEPYSPVKQIPISNVLGIVEDKPCPGALIFRIEAETYRLDPIVSPDGERLFIIFADETNGIETYGAGRFLHVDRPRGDGKTTVDFNKAHNPACAFTEFATCPLPPVQNRLPVPIEAGEKLYRKPNLGGEK